MPTVVTALDDERVIVHVSTTSAAAPTRVAAPHESIVSVARWFPSEIGAWTAISEHMSGTGSWGQDDKDMTEILENTLARGTRFGWDLVNAGNRHARHRR